MDAGAGGVVRDLYRVAHCTHPPCLPQAKAPESPGMAAAAVFKPLLAQLPACMHAQAKGECECCLVLPDAGLMKWRQVITGKMQAGEIACDVHAGIYAGLRFMCSACHPLVSYIHQCVMHGIHDMNACIMPSQASGGKWAYP